MDESRSFFKIFSLGSKFFRSRFRNILVVALGLILTIENNGGKSRTTGFACPIQNFKRAPLRAMRPNVEKFQENS